MEEEIDIAELLKRVKKGEAPKRISINNLEYCYENKTTFGDYYRDTEKYGKVFLSNEYDFRAMANLKIKILDKPIIEELEIRPSRNYKDINTDVLVYIDNEGKECENFYSVDVYIARKINEIIRHINNEEGKNEPK